MADADLLFPAVVGAMLLVVLPATLLWASHRTRRWNAMGEALGLLPVGPAPRLALLEGHRTLRGARGRFTVQVRHFSTGGGRSRQHWTAVEAAAPGADPGFTLRLTPEGLGSALAKAVGGQDVELGDPAFDARFRVRSSDPHRAPGVLDGAVRTHLAGVGRFGELRVEPGLPLADGTWVDAAGVAGFVRMPPEHGDAVRRVAGALGQALPEPGADQAALVRYIRRGVVLDPEVVQAALPAVVGLAESLEARVPRR